MTSFNYHFRASTRKGTNKGSIFLRVVHDRKYFNIALGLKVFPAEWDESARTVIVPHTGSVRYNALRSVRESLDENAAFMERAITEMASHGQFDISELRERVLSGSGSCTLGAFTETVIAGIAARQVRTARAYRSALRSFMEFNGGKDIPLSLIREKLMGQYELWLKDKGLQLNTISFYMRNLRAVYNRAVRADMIPRPARCPFRDVYTGVDHTAKRGLEARQVSQLIALDPGLVSHRFRSQSPLSRCLRDALALFLFALLAQGMAFVDVAYLRKDNVVGNRIKYRRKKTGQMIEATVCREMKSIMEYFSDRTSDSPYVFPIIRSSAKTARLQYESGLRIQNHRLAKLSKLIPDLGRITTHAARHSWASIAKNEKIETALISEALGHNNEQTTRIYLGRFKHDLLDKVNERIRRAIKKAV